VPVVKGRQRLLVASRDPREERGVFEIGIACSLHGRITQSSVCGWLIHSAPWGVTRTSSSSPT
jgi:hypothetical protein